MGMAIKNKDGTIYKLNGPIPVMLEQERWGEFHVHNFDWNSTIEKDSSTVKPLDSDFGNLRREGFVEELEKTKPVVPEIKVVESDSVSPVEAPVEEPKEPEMPELSSEIVPEPDLEPPRVTQKALPPDLQKHFVWCLPATMSEKVDELYGDRYTTIKYQRPFSFEAIIVENSDLMFKMWTTVDKITRGSVLFPRVGEKRWWRVEEIEAKSGGFLVFGMPSDFQPSFTENR
jgi:hypothetical protein